MEIRYYLEQYADGFVTETLWDLHITHNAPSITSQKTTFFKETSHGTNDYNPTCRPLSKGSGKVFHQTTQNGSNQVACNACHAHPIPPGGLTIHAF